MFLGYTFNEYGTPVTACQCDYCGNRYTLCPQVDADDERWTTGCLAVRCDSYDEARDIDKRWGEQVFFGAIMRDDPQTE